MTLLQTQYDPPPARGDKPLLPWVGERSRMGLDLGCSTQWLHKSQMGRGRRVPQGKERVCWCWGLQSG